MAYVDLSGKLTWVPLYLLFMWLIYRKAGWRNMLLFLVLAALSIVFTDMVAGAFKHTGLLKNILPDLGVRLRPMYTPELEGMVHVVKLGGKYGSISAHAATTCTVALLASLILQRRWIWCISAFWVVRYAIREYISLTTSRWIFSTECCWGFALVLSLI